MTQADKARIFKELHDTQSPLVLYNIWDAGSAKAVADAGAKAVATGSWSVAGAQGFVDGEVIPLDLLLQIVDRIVQTVDLPVSVDFEGGYDVAPEQVAANVGKLIDLGVVGINFEDRIVGGQGLHHVGAQVARLEAIRQMADAANVALFVNARTDLFLGSDPDTHDTLMGAALERAAAYEAAGADGFFIPGLTDRDLIAKITDATRLPVNVMLRAALKSPDDVAGLGVSRTSFGPGPFVAAMRDLTARYTALS